MSLGAAARSRLEEVLAHPRETLVGVDFDGTLAPKIGRAHV